MFPEIARPGAVPPRAKPGRAAGPAPSGTTDPLLLDDGVLTLRDEKLSETEDKDRQFPERFYGRFDRRIPLGYEIDGNAAEARVPQRGADRDPVQDRKGAVAGQAHPDQGLTPVRRRRGIRPPAALWQGGPRPDVRRVAGSRLACAAQAAADLTGGLAAPRVAVEVIAGAEDGASPPDLVAALAAAIPGGGAHRPARRRAHSAGRAPRAMAAVIARLAGTASVP